MNKKLRELHESANLNIQNGNTQDAMNAYVAICKLDSSNHLSWFNYGMLAANLSKYKTAETAFRNAKKLAGNDARAALMLARVYESQGKLTRAIKEYIDIYNTAPDAQHEYQLGILYGNNGDFQKSIDWFDRFLKNNTDSHALHCVASAYESLEDINNAKLYYERAIASADDPHVILSNYGALLHKDSDWDNAIATYNRSIQINDSYYKSHFNLATTLHAIGEHEAAKKHYTIAISLKPDDAELYIGLGKTHNIFSEYPVAINCYLKAISLDSEQADAHANLGLALISSGKYEDAFASLQTASRLDPGNIEIKCAIARLLERESEYTQAQQLIDELLSISNDNSDIAVTYGAISRKTGRIDEAIKYLERTTNNHSITNLEKSSVYFQLGKLYDDTHKYTLAFDAYDTGNRSLPYPYDETIALDAIDTLKSIFSKNNLLSANYSSDSTAEPIFIFGMPRSGTSLTEQILASHRNITGCGELAYMAAATTEIREIITDSVNHSFDLSRLNQDNINRLSQEYLTRAKQDHPYETRITDKMPHNFQYLGAIQMLFPKAKLVHINRNPIDNCLSIFFSNFNALHRYSATLKNTASYYKNVYLNMMEYWRANLSLPIYELQYGNLVENQEQETRKLLEFCELDWDDNCLNFHNTTRSVTTLSYDQVKQPIYKKSKNRWKNYRDDISDLIREFPEYASD